MPIVRLHEIDLFVTECAARLPFRFGAVTLTSATLLHLRMAVGTASGERATGWSADLMVPKWFEKDPGKSVEDDVATLAASAVAARDAALAVGATPRTAHDHWREIDRECGGDLVRGFGVALVERALIDATCRALRCSFADALRAGALGITLDTIPARSVRVRHTIGMADALRAADTRGDDDGFPRSLEDDIRVYDLDAFKIKIGAGVDTDLDRLEAIAAVLDDTVPRPVLVTLDGNEQYPELDRLDELLARLRESPWAARLLESLAYIEQPVPRDRTFDPATAPALAQVTRTAPVIIDEADGDRDAFARAIEIGYRGVSVKGCKGVFRAIANRERCLASGGRLFQSAEDLTTLPVVALQEDLALVAALGLEHVERNGHHYFRGLDHLGDEDRAAALERHPDLYREHAGTVALRIERGRLALGSVQCVGLGYDAAPWEGSCTTRLGE